MSTIFRPYVPHNQRSDRSARDRLRHREKVKDSIRKNIGDILSEEAIIGHDKNKVIKIPIRSIKEYRFIYGDNAPGVAQGTGKEKVGDVVGPADAGDANIGDKAGDQPGIDALETDVTLEELINIMFDDLELPDLEKRYLRQIVSEQSFKRKGIRHAGIRARLNKKATARQRVRRKLAAQGKNAPAGERFPFHDDDMRYFHIVPAEREVANAVIVCIMDTSGSMSATKKYLARSFYFLLYQFVKQAYRNVEVVFVSHHTEAKEVNEEEFFHKVESGGTYISSGYTKALEIIDARYHPSLWNVYAFHCSDGDNFYSDNERAVQAALELCDRCNLFGYGEIKPAGSAYYSGSMLEVFKQITRDNFQVVTIDSKEDLWPAFKGFLSKDKQVRVGAASSGGARP